MGNIEDTQEEWNLLEVAIAAEENASSFLGKMELVVIHTKCDLVLKKLC